MKNMTFNKLIYSQVLGKVLILSLTVPKNLKNVSDFRQSFIIVFTSVKFPCLQVQKAKKLYRNESHLIWCKTALLS